MFNFFGSLRRLVFTLILLTAGCIQSCSSGYVTIEDAREHYDNNEKEVTELVSYFRAVCPPSQGVIVSKAAGIGRVNIGLYNITGSVDSAQPNVGGECYLGSDEMEGYLQQLGWTTEVVSTLIEKLEKVNCRSIRSGNPIVLEYRENSYAGTSYRFYETSLNDSLVQHAKLRNDKAVISDKIFIGLVTGL